MTTLVAPVGVPVVQLVPTNQSALVAPVQQSLTHAALAGAGMARSKRIVEASSSDSRVDTMPQALACFSASTNARIPYPPLRSASPSQPAAPVAKLVASRSRGGRGRERDRAGNKESRCADLPRRAFSHDVMQRDRPQPQPFVHAFIL